VATSPNLSCVVRIAYLVSIAASSSACNFRLFSG
jgi:hypothetical protein